MGCRKVKEHQPLLLKKERHRKLSTAKANVCKAIRSDLEQTIPQDIYRTRDCGMRDSPYPRRPVVAKNYIPKSCVFKDKEVKTKLGEFLSTRPVL